MVDSPVAATGMTVDGPATSAETSSEGMIVFVGEVTNVVIEEPAGSCKTRPEGLSTMSGMMRGQLEVPEGV